MSAISDRNGYISFTCICILPSTHTHTHTHTHTQAISCHYASSHCHYLDDVEGSEHANIAEEVMELAKKRLGPDTEVTFQVCTTSGNLSVVGQENVSSLERCPCFRD